MSVQSFNNAARILPALVLAAALPPAAVAQTRPAADRTSETLSIFVGPDGSKQPQDLGINANMGIRVSANIGLPLSRAAGLGLQIGVGQNFSDAAVHVLDQISDTSSRKQTFVTAAVFQRAGKASWVFGYDFQSQRYFDDVTLGQLRARVGFDVRVPDQIGVDVRAGISGTDAMAPAGTPVRLDPITQVTAFHRHTWENKAQTTVSVGMANGHDNVVLPFGADERDSPVWVYGAEIFVPLSERFALLGSSNLILPAATGTVDAYLGVAWFPGRGAMKTSTNRLAPVMSVANNPEFAVNLKLK